MTAPPPTDWIDQGQNAIWFFGFAFAGFLVMIFGQPIKPIPKQRTAPKPRKTKPPKPRKAKGETPRKHTKPKRQKPKVWATTPDYTPEQIFRIEEMFRRGRGY